MRDKSVLFLEFRSAPVSERDIRSLKIRHKQFEIRDLESLNRATGSQNLISAQLVSVAGVTLYHSCEAYDASSRH